MAETSIAEQYAAHVEARAGRWAAALEAEAFDAVAVHAGSPIVSFLDDYHYPFRTNPHLLAWAPLTTQHDSVLVFEPGERPLLAYYQPDDYWYLPPADPDEWWARHFDLRPVRDPGDWAAFIPRGQVAFIGDAPVLDDYEDVNPPRLINRLHLDRTRKTDYEISCMAQANACAARAHVAAEQAFREGLSELEIHQRYCGAAGLLDEELPYGNIVALNAHGAVLHYQQREREAPEERRAFLIDAGATRHAYASDITRTYSAEPGVFAELIEAMEAVQLELCDGMQAGVDYRDMHLQAHAAIAGVLSEAGIIRQSPGAAVESGLSAVFFPHGLGHFLGLQTHDVAGLISDADGTEIPRPEGHPFLRLTRTLEPGNVLTVEPGLYFIDSLLQRWKSEDDGEAIDWEKVEALRPFGGIRIEDNVVVTDAAPRNLTREAFSGIA